MAALIPEFPGARGTGSYTVVDYSALGAAVATLNGVGMTEGIEWTAATSNDETAISLAAAINTLTVETTCTAVAVANVVQITANSVGDAPVIGLSSSDNVNLHRSAANLTGGENPGVGPVLVFTGPLRLKSVTVASSGTNIGVQILNGVVDTADEYDHVLGVSDQTVIHTYEGGLLLPAGCYVIPEDEVTAVVLEFSAI